MLNEDDASMFRCTACARSSLKAVPQQAAARAAEPDEGLACENCGAIYPKVGGVYRFVSQQAYAGSFGYQWNLHRSTQLDSHTKMPLTRDRLMVATGWPARLDGQKVLEAGSGAGRFTEVIAETGADLFTFDLSTAVDANWRNNSRFPNVRFAQGNILDAPFARHAFDHVVCLGVIQHTPDPAASFRSLVKHVKPGGSITIDCYSKSLRSMLPWKYLLRPVLKRVGNERLYSLVERWVPPLISPTAWLRRAFGPAGTRLMPILEYSHLGIPAELNRQWAILDTFDMYSPAFDRPQTIRAVTRWYEEAGLVEIRVQRGLNGVIARGRVPA